VSTGRETRVELDDKMDEEINVKFVERKDKVIVEDDKKNTVALRYLSPDGKSSIEISTYWNPKDVPLKINGGILQQNMFYTTNEQEIRTKLGL
jgi:hypothetical protein